MFSLVEARLGLSSAFGTTHCRGASRPDREDVFTATFWASWLVCCSGVTTRPLRKSTRWSFSLLSSPTPAIRFFSTANPKHAAASRHVFLFMLLLIISLSCLCACACLYFPYFVWFHALFVFFSFSAFAYESFRIASSRCLVMQMDDSNGFLFLFFFAPNIIVFVMHLPILSANLFIFFPCSYLMTSEFKRLFQALL